MGNYCVAWFLLLSNVVLLGLSGFGIGLTALNFGVPVKPPPEPPALNATTVTTPKPYDTYGYRYNRNEPPKAFEDYVSSTRRYASYSDDPGAFLACPCGVIGLMSAILVLSGICSRKTFSKTIGLYGSLGMWIITLVYIIIYQNISTWHSAEDNDFWFKFTWVLGIQIAMLSLLSLQIILAIWELKRQKIAWPTLHFSHLFTLNTVFLVARITVSSFTFVSFLNSHFWTGMRDDTHTEYNLNYYSYPRKRYPEYFVYPVAAAILYDIVSCFEGLLSHLAGYVHIKMLSFSSLLMSVLYGGIIVVSSPVFVLRIFGLQIYPEMMNWAIAGFFTCFFHAIACLAKPEAITAPPPALRAVINEAMPSVSYNSEDLRNHAVSIRNKFKGSDTLLYNTIVLVLNSLAILLQCIDFRFFWGFVTMLCGNVAMINRVLPIVMMEVLTQRIETVPVFKMLMHFMLECVPLIAGVFGSFWWFYGPNAGAMVLNGLLVLLQLYKLVTNPAIKAAVTNLAEQEAEGSTGRHLISETEDATDSQPEDREEIGRIYQPLP